MRFTSRLRPHSASSSSSRRAGGRDPGVEHDRVEAAEARDRRVDGAIDDGGVGEVADDRHGPVEPLEPDLLDVGEHEMGAAAARSRATSRPMPEAAPVTSTTWPASSGGGGRSVSL